ncbi:hypothetical protein Dip510_000906 [Elusimicrobium posterum]|uniref:hypothetical protein n=1 Tax=Elusimicrobium posterum TaxID=3116653 RepID=UPI003C70C8CD
MKKLLPLIFICVFLSACSLFRSYTYTDITAFYTTEALELDKTFAIVAQEKQYNNLEFKKYAQLTASNIIKRNWREVSATEADYLLYLTYNIGNPVEKQYTTTVTTKKSSEQTKINGSFDGKEIKTTIKTLPSEEKKDEVRSYLSYAKNFNIDIFNKNGEKIFEGHATIDGRGDNFNKISKCIIDSLMENFPGSNGATLTIKKENSVCIN